MSETRDQITRSVVNNTGEATVSSEIAITISSASLNQPGRYVIGEEIARGGMGEVYRATDTVLEREVAVKVLQTRYELNSRTALRFEEEAKITGQLQHPNIPAVHDLGTLPDGRPFLAMKLIKGDTLESLLKLRTSVEQERGRYLAVFEQICQAMAYAHAHEVIHRDLKPANIMVGNFGEVQVMDWGLAKVLATSASRGRESTEPDPNATTPGTEIRSTRDGDDHYTQAGSVLGTPGFMAPEQALGAVHKIDKCSDVFGLGGILAMILTGKPPFHSDSSQSALIMAADGEIGPCLERLRDCGAEPDWIAVAQKCLQPDRSQRYRDAAELGEVVARLRVEAEERARQAELEAVRIVGEQAKIAEQRKRRRTQFALALALFGLLLVVGFSALVASLWRTAEQERIIADQAKDEAESQRDAAELAKSLAVQAETAAIDARNKLAVFRDGRAAAFSPDGTRIVTGSNQGTVTVWDAKSGVQIVTLKSHTDSVQDVSFSPDGRRIVSVSWDRTVIVWDATTGQEILKLRGHTGGVNAAMYSPDGKRIITGSMDNTAKIWDARTGAELLTLKGHLNSVTVVGFNTVGTRMLTGSADGTTRIWDSGTGAELLKVIRDTRAK